MKTLTLTLSITLAITGLQNIFAQSQYLEDISKSSVTLQWEKPIYSSDFYEIWNVNALSSTVFLKARIKLTEKANFVTELPISHFGGEISFFGVSENIQSKTVLGNIYLGAELKQNPSSESGTSSFNLGIFLPTNGSSDMGSFSGFTSEVNRIDAFFDETISFNVSSNFRRFLSDQFEIRISPGFRYNIYTGEFSDQIDNEIDMIYSLHGTYKSGSFRTHLGLIGRNPISGNDREFAEGGVTQGYLGIGKSFGRIMPELFLRKYLTESMNDLTKFNMGIALSYQL